MASSAQGSRKRTASSASKARGRSSSNTNSRTNTKSRQPAERTLQESAITNEIVLIGIFALTVLLFLCNFGVIGVVGDAVSNVMFGIFGLTAYAVPVLAFVAVAFGISNQGNRIAIMKLTAGIVLFFLVGVVCELISANNLMDAAYSVKDLYTVSAEGKTGGGVTAGSLAWVLHHFLGMVGTVLLILVLAIICIVVITEKSLVGGVKSSGRRVYETARSDVQVRRERSERRREENQARREEAMARKREQVRLKEEEKARQEAEKILRMDRKVSGVMADTTLKENAGKVKSRDDIHEITVESLPEEKIEEVRKSKPMGDPAGSFDQIRIHGVHQQTLQETENFDSMRQESVQTEQEASFDGVFEETVPEDIESYKESPAVVTETLFAREADVYRDMKEVSLTSGRKKSSSDNVISFQKASQREEQEDLKEVGKAEEENSTSFEDTAQPAENAGQRVRPRAVPPVKPATAAEATAVGQQMAKQEKAAPKAVDRPYCFPPLNLLHKSAGKNGQDSVKELKETAMRLQETLQTFGVRVTITDISQGPAVTRYELQPEQGVKVSKILSLSDDIKLNLAATDIRIEAPIPGKAAIGIEVPNKENTAVGLRELLETKEFKEFPSNIAFAVGKDIAGKVVVSDIAKMPHMLIAGSTGSGKSVCINTLIMSILYKAKPTDVKLILVDPKVVELSVYNGIPHLLIPVVTDPKKASAALQWGVAEMTDRYKKFADYNVRDLKGFNKKMAELREKGETDVPDSMPQIVIIVDELADLMMVAPGEVEESICRLAQLARAAGIHLIIATQRPSVDVITGLIKANMPSRVAFAVSSGVDSRTILDMNGAEKLLGKGDMLFYPQGYSKPARIQGAFVSDGEVSDVVDFLKNQAIGNVYNTDIEEKMKNLGSSAGSAASGGGSTYDEYFVDAGKFIIDKDKASIGMLQRVFKIGFNRAARIMDQLAEVGVVGEEEGTKPRKVLMTMDEFEQLVEEII